MYMYTHIVTKVSEKGIGETLNHLHLRYIEPIWEKLTINVCCSEMYNYDRRMFQDVDMCVH